MGGFGPNPFSGAAFDYPAEVHHDRPVRDLAHHRQVVRDEQHPQAGLGHDPGQQVGHLGLRRCVERTYGFVGHHTTRFGGQHAGNGDALALAAGELVREPMADGRRQAHPFEQFADPRCRLVVTDFGPRPEADGIGDLPPDPAPRVERRVRVLEHHLQRPELRRPGATPLGLDRLTAITDLTGTRRHQADGGAAQGRFPAAGLAHQADDLPLAHAERGPHDGSHGGLASAHIRHVEPLQLEQRCP